MEPRTDGIGREPARRRDVGIAESCDFPEQEDLAVIVGEAAERRLELDAECLIASGRMVIDGDSGRPPAGGADVVARQVSGNLEDPGASCPLA
jgi:hypothetical protein